MEFVFIKPQKVEKLSFISKEDQWGVAHDITWKEADALCRSKGLSLYSITSSDDVKYLHDAIIYMEREEERLTPKVILIGLTINKKVVNFTSFFHYTNGIKIFFYLDVYSIFSCIIY